MSGVKHLMPTELDLATRELYDLARGASAYAYAPYSKFHVGASVRTKQGAVFRGCNVENASFGLTSCAERNAIFAAVAAEGGDMRLQEVAVYVCVATASPCGACRQVIAEFSENARILFADGDHIVDAVVGELLPSGFVQPGRL
jgi:cytidine deaminase